VKRALIVDDQPEVCELLARTLQCAGIDALTLHNGEHASEFLAEGKFDVVFLDLHMASVDGLALLQQIRKANPSQLTPVILLSDDQRPSALSVAFDAGASFFLYKPIDKDRILKLLRAAQGALEYKHRQTRRIPVKAKATVRSGAEILEGETINMSLTGVLLSAPRPLPIGTSVDLYLHLIPHAKPVTSSGSVARIDDNRLGIRLSKMSMQESTRLQEFLLPLIPDVPQ
jgi:CheY-like chemotaxis protein